MLLLQIQSNLSTIENTRNYYGNDIIKLVRIFRKLDLNLIDFHVCNLFLVDNKSIAKHQKIQNKRFSKLFSNYVGKINHDLQKVIYN